MMPPILSYREWLAVSTAFLARLADVGGLPPETVTAVKVAALQALERLNPLERERLVRELSTAVTAALEAAERDAARHLQRDLFTSQVRELQAELEV